jgi:hypothetical protein
VLKFNPPYGVDNLRCQTRFLKFLKPRSLLLVKDCFKNESNAVFGVFSQRLFKGLSYGKVSYTRQGDGIRMIRGDFERKYAIPLFL